MHNRYIRTLPFPPTSYFTREIVAQIKAIPEEELEYSAEEIEWMRRAIVDIERNFESIVRHAKLAGRMEGSIVERKKQYEIAIAVFEKKTLVQTT